MTGWVLVADHADHPKAGRIGEIVGYARIACVYAVRFPDGRILPASGHILSKWVVA